ncbi:MAG TPA: universal stress protein [Actinomycetospora sp.]|uniref:universal stress protein n=1 Tax=Actinomycetospora sp. TaxID=1872135 RepID=UPI002F3E7FC1
MSEQAAGAPGVVIEESAGSPPQAPSAAGQVTGVVVGVDDSNSARAAVAWAAQAADRRGLALHLVEVLPAPGGAADEAGVPRGRARALLSRAKSIAHGISPDLVVTMHALSGRVGPALVDYATEASLLVVGSNGPGGPIPLSLGSVLGEVTTHCRCPVILVPAGGRTRARTEDAPVLVALDDSPDGERALAFAADAAERRDVALRVLTEQASDEDGPQLAQLRESHPGLEIRTETVTGPLEDELLGADASVQLIVAPSRRRGGVLGSGWTGHFLPILCKCPVAVVSTMTRESTTLA